MGTIFSQEEKKELAPNLLGTDPMALATVIWDSINEEGMDSTEENEEGGSFGITFNGDGTEEGKNNVVLWNDGETTSLPKNVFLEIVKFSGEQVLESFEENYDLERSKELGESVAMLRLALQQLEQYMSTVECTISAEAYRKLVDGKTETEETESDDDDDSKLPPVPTLELARLPTATPTADEDDKDNSNSDEEATPPPIDLLQRRRSTKGIEGVMDRLPELRRRVSDDEPASPTSPLTSPKPFDKVKKKVKLLSLFHISPEEDNVSADDAMQLGKSHNKGRSFSVDNFYKRHNPPSHQLSLPSDLSSLATLSQVSKMRRGFNTQLWSPDTSPVPSLPGSIEDVSSKSPEHTTTPSSPVSQGTFFRMATPVEKDLGLPVSTPPGSSAFTGAIGSVTSSTSTLVTPTSNNPTTPGSTSSKFPSIQASSANPPSPPKPSGSSSIPVTDTSASLTPPGGGHNASSSNTPIGRGKKPNLPTPPGSLDRDSPTGGEAEHSHHNLAWACSLDSISGSTGNLTASTGPQNFPASESTDFNTTPLLPGSVDATSPPPPT